MERAVGGELSAEKPLRGVRMRIHNQRGKMQLAGALGDVVCGHGCGRRKPRRQECLRHEKRVARQRGRAREHLSKGFSACCIWKVIGSHGCAFNSLLTASACSMMRSVFPPRILRISSSE